MVSDLARFYSACSVWKLFRSAGVWVSYSVYKLVQKCFRLSDIQCMLILLEMLLFECHTCKIFQMCCLSVIQFIQTFSEVFFECHTVYWDIFRSVFLWVSYSICKLFQKCCRLSVIVWSKVALRPYEMYNPFVKVDSARRRLIQSIGPIRWLR